MAAEYVVAGLEAFKKSQLAIFDAALSLVDFFDTAVVDTVDAFQDIFSPSFFQREEMIHGSWEQFLLILQGCFKSIRLYFLFTLTLVCCTALMLRYRKRGAICVFANPRRPIGGLRPVTTRSLTSPHIGHSVAAFGPGGEGNHSHHSTTTRWADSSPLSIAKTVSLTSDATNQSRGKLKPIIPSLDGSVRYKKNAKNWKLESPGSVTTASNNTKNWATRNTPTPNPKIVSREQKANKRRRGGSLGISTHKKSAISTAISSILNEKTPSPRIRGTNKSSAKGQQPFARRFPRMVKNKVPGTTQRPISENNRAQVFILLNDVDKNKSYQVTRVKRPSSPRRKLQKMPRVVANHASPKRRTNSPSAMKKRSPSLGRKNKTRLRRAGSADPVVPSPSSRKTTADLVNALNEKQKVISIPYLHVITPKPRPFPSAAGGRRSKINEPAAVVDKPKQVTPMINHHRVKKGLSPKSRMTKTTARHESRPKVKNSKRQKRRSKSPTKTRCKACKKVRQVVPRPFDSNPLFSTQTRTSANVGSIFCFSPRTKLPPPFHNARINSNRDNDIIINSNSTRPQQPTLSSNVRQCLNHAEDTNMNKAVLKFELQNEIPTSDKINNEPFAIGENTQFPKGLATKERLQGAIGSSLNVQKHCNFLSYRIQHNVHPMDISEPHNIIKATKNRNNPPNTKDAYLNQNNTRPQGENNHIPRAFGYSPTQQQWSHDNVFCLADRNGRRQAGFPNVFGSQPSVYDEESKNIDVFSKSRFENFIDKDVPRLSAVSNNDVIYNNQPYSMFSHNLKSTIESTRNRQASLGNGDSVPNRESICNRVGKVESISKPLKDRRGYGSSHQSSNSFRALNGRFGDRKINNNNRPAKSIQQENIEPVINYKSRASSAALKLKRANNRLDGGGGGGGGGELPFGHCDKIKSQKWRHRHEPYRYRCVQTKSNKSTRDDDSAIDVSTTPYTATDTTLRSSNALDTASRGNNNNKKADVNRFGGRETIPTISNLAYLARFTPSTTEEGSNSNSNDVPRSEIDPCTFSLRSSVSSYQNKNNCSPSRLAKPFIKPLPVHVHTHPVVDNITRGPSNSHSHSAMATIEHDRQLQTDDGTGGCGSKDTESQDTMPNPSFDSEMISDGSKQQVCAGDDTPCMDSTVTDTRALKTDDVDSTGEGPPKQMESSTSAKNKRAGLLRNTTMHLLLSPHSDTKLGSVRKASLENQHSYYRPRNKAVRQHKLFKYPLITRKVVMRTIGKHAPTTYSDSDNRSSTRGQPVSLGIQTSHTSLIHTGVQTSPQEDQAACKGIPVVPMQNINSSPLEIADKMSIPPTYSHLKRGLDKSHAHFLSSGERKSPEKDSSKFAKNHGSNDKVTTKNEENTLFAARQEEDSSKDTTHGKEQQETELNCQGPNQGKKKMETGTILHTQHDGSLVGCKARNFHIVPITSNDKKDSRSNKTGHESTRHFEDPFRRQSLPMTTSSAGGTKSDILVPSSSDSSPSSHFLDPTGKEWLTTRPKWGNANEDEVNRRVERALKLRQELQKWRTDNTPNSVEKRNKISLFRQTCTESFKNAPNSSFAVGSNNDRRAQAIKETETKRRVSCFKKSSSKENCNNVDKSKSIDSSPTYGILPAVKAELSSASDTLIKTFPFVARQVESYVSENTPTEDNKYTQIGNKKTGDSATETDNTSETPEQYHSFQEPPAATAAAACNDDNDDDDDVPFPGSTEVRPSSATTGSSRLLVEDPHGNDVLLGHAHQHRQQHHCRPGVTTKNSPPIKISKMENVIQTEYPKLVGELVQALPHVPLTSFVEWFIETSSYPGQFGGSDDSISTTADVKEAATKDEVSPFFALDTADHDRAAGIRPRRDRANDGSDTKSNNSSHENVVNNKLKDNALFPSNSRSASSDFFSRNRAFTPMPSNNNARLHESETELVVADKLSSSDEDGGENVASINRILLSRKESSVEISESPPDTADNRRSIITLRQASDSNASSFAGDLSLPSRVDLNYPE